MTLPSCSLAPGATGMDLVVTETARIADGVVRVRLSRADGADCAPYVPGAHLRIEVPVAGGEPVYRRYSLTGDGATAPYYEIAVLRCEGGVGSAWVHRLVPGGRVGALLDNAFPLQDAPGGHLLIAGGIGITPILSMARRLQREALPFELHYAGTHPDRMAFRDEVAQLGAACHLYDRSGGSLRDRLPYVLATPAPGRHVYVCGPASLIAAVVELAGRSGWPPEQVHFELFDGSLAQAGDAAFDVELRQSGQRITVKADQSLLGALLEVGVEPLYDCKRGECGMCLIPVLEGTPDHRDHYLSESGRARNDAICVCVSRASSPLLVLDL